MRVNGSRDIDCPKRYRGNLLLTQAARVQEPIPGSADVDKGPKIDDISNLQQIGVAGHHKRFRAAKWYRSGDSFQWSGRG